MARDRELTYGQERITLRQTLVVAVLLHLMLGGVMQWRPDLLWSEPVFPDLAPQPIEFRFVDIPDTEPPPEPPETEVLSDRDREAGDLSPRDDAADPFSEGNTSQEVLRSTPTAAPGVAAVQPTPSGPPAAEVEPQPELSPREKEAAEVAEDAAAEGAPVTLPPRERRFRESLARLQSFVLPEIYDNPEGGSPGPSELVSFDTRGYPLGAYLDEIIRIIERNWKSNIPPAARLPGMEGATFVRLSIQRDHTSEDAETARIVLHRVWPSGHPSFDQAAVFALEISNPLPPIPSFFPYEQLDGRIGFLYNLDPDQVTFPPGQ